jgi:ribosomal protein S18 acetylase RimI-like enzyme
MEVWNEAFTGRGTVRLRTSSPLERQAFGRAYFDPAGLILAEEDGRCIGFVHAGFGANEQESELAYTSGVVCLIAVRPSHQRRGVGGELLMRAEASLRGRGAQLIHAGQVAPFDPFYQGLTGGSELAGFLTSDAAAEPFFIKHGYQIERTTLVLQRSLSQPLKQFDARFQAFRQRFELHEGVRRRGNTWWHECRYGLLEPLAFCLEDKTTNTVAGLAHVFEMEGFSFRWGQPAVGLFQLEIRPDLRRQGIGKYLLVHILRRIQEQYFALLELQVPEDNRAVLHLCHSLGFEQVDSGHVYLRVQE